MYHNNLRGEKFSPRRLFMLAVLPRAPAAKRHYIGNFRISFYMKLISKIIEELGGDTSHAFTVCPGKLAHFCGVKSVSELTPEKVVLVCGKKIITCEGKNLTAAEYFQGDMTVSGNITGISIE